MRINYRTTDLQPYINWAYFYHAWDVPPQSDEAVRLKSEAERMLALMRPHVKVKCAVEILPAHSEGDDIVLEKTRLCECGQYHPTGETVRLPMLRQQMPGKDGFCLCLSDFVSPREDRVGVFATSVDSKSPLDSSDLMAQTLHDRLAEAAAERLHEDVRRRIWGYAPDEHLTMAELHAEHFQGIRPAVGYPCLPDVSVNFLIDRIISFSNIGVSLTEHGMMRPHASVSGLMISHPSAHYFCVGPIDDAQLKDYAARRGMGHEEMRKYLAGNIRNNC